MSLKIADEDTAILELHDNFELDPTMHVPKGTLNNVRMGHFAQRNNSRAAYKF